MKRSTYMLIGMLIILILVIPFIFNYRGKTDFGDERINISGESKLVKLAPVSVMNVIVNDNNHSRYDQQINIISYEGDSIECQYDSDWDKYLTIKENSDTLTFFFDLDKIRAELKAIGSYEVHTREIYLKVPQSGLKWLNTKESKDFVNLFVNKFSADSLNVVGEGEFLLQDSRIGYMFLRDIGNNINFSGSNKIQTLRVFLNNNTLHNSGELDVKVLKLEGQGTCDMYKINANKVIVNTIDSEYIKVKYRGITELAVEKCKY